MGKVVRDNTWDFLEVGMLFFFFTKRKIKNLYLYYFVPRDLEGNKENLNF